LGSPLPRLLGDGGAVGPEKGFPALRATADVVERGHGRGDRVVLIAFALPDHQQPARLGPPHPTLSPGRRQGAGVRRSQADGQYQDVPNQSHHRLSKPAGCGDLSLTGTASESIKSRMNSAASWAFW